METEMRTVGAFEGKTQLSNLLDVVERGEEVLITRHGKPVARLVPAEVVDRAKVSAAIAKLKALAKGTPWAVSPGRSCGTRAAGDGLRA